VLRAGQCLPICCTLIPARRHAWRIAMAQMLASRRWSRVLVLHGNDAGGHDPGSPPCRLRSKRFGLETRRGASIQTVGGSRAERDLANPLLVTANVEYGRGVGGRQRRRICAPAALSNFRCRGRSRRRLVCSPWHGRPTFERFGAPQPCAPLPARRWSPYDRS